MTPDTEQPVIKARHELTIKAWDILRRLKPGERITYAKIHAAMGVDPQGDGRKYVTSARRILQKSRRMVIEPYEEVGLVYLNDAQLGTSGSRRIRRVYRAAKREGRKLDCVNDAATLTDAQREALTKHQLILQDAEARLAPRLVRQVEAMPVDNTGGIDLQAIIDGLQRNR